MSGRTAILFTFVSLSVGACFLPSAFAEEPGACQRAVKLVNRVQDAGPSFPKASREQLFEEAVGLCPQMPEIHYNFGLFLLTEGRYSEARDKFEKAKEIEDRVEYRLGIARAYLGDSDLSSAKTIYEEVLALDRLNPKALQGLAIVAARSGDSDKASELLQQALSVDPDDAIALYNLGALFEKKGLKEEAEVQYAKAIKRDSKHFLSLFHLALLEFQRGEVNSAVVRLERAAEVGPDEPKVFRALGVAYERLGRFEKAELAFRKALALDAEDQVSRANLALVLVRMEKPAQVLELYENLEGDGYAGLSIESLLALGLARKGLGNYEAAEELLKSAYQKAPKDPRILKAMISVLEEAGESSKAEKFRSILEEIG